MLITIKHRRQIEAYERSIEVSHEQAIAYGEWLEEQRALDAFYDEQSKQTEIDEAWAEYNYDGCNCCPCCGCSCNDWMDALEAWEVDYIQWIYKTQKAG